MTEQANEETELTQEFGQLVRVLTGSSMQLQEASTRRNQMRSYADSQAQQQRHAQDKAMAEMVNETMRDRNFWATAGSEEIADHVTVAAHLSASQPKARGAYMYASDMLRNQYGINLEEINRDHPTSLSDRHAAIRDELDAFMERQRVEHDRVSEPGVVLDETFQLETQPRLAIERNGPIVMEPRTPTVEEAQLLRDEHAAKAKGSQYAAEHRRDENHALSEAATGGREPNPYQRVTPEQYTQLRNTTSEWLATSRHRQGLVFARSTKDRVFNGQATKINMPKSQNTAYRGVNRQHDRGLSR